MNEANGILQKAGLALHIHTDIRTYTFIRRRDVLGRPASLTTKLKRKTATVSNDDDCVTADWSWMDGRMDGWMDGDGRSEKEGERLFLHAKQS